jgi:non-ribosomal peptide synthetase component F
MIGSFQSLLASIIADPDRPVSRLALLDAAERERIVVHWNATRAPYPWLQSLPALFAHAVERSPNAIAIVDSGRTVTYAELDRRSREVAHRLRAFSMACGSAALASLGSSCCAAVMHSSHSAVCVPLDPTHPVERLAATLRDAGSAAVVTAGAAARTLAASPEINALPTVTLDRSNFETFACAPEPPVAPGGTGLAQIIYTSGSTGSPKGVAITHRAIARLVCGTDYVRLGADDVVAHVSNPAFDAATFEIFGALLNGATLAVVPRETILSPRAFAAALEA